MLYICATPIGNLGDISLRALEILKSCHIILCEDTRVSHRLFSRHNINYTKLISLHEHNEAAITQKVLSYLEQGLSVAQISDAGTPGIADPGSYLCTKVIEAGFKVSPIPGACAYTALLSVAGLGIPSLFYGFLPPKSSERCKALNSYRDVDYSVGIYEAPHRIIACVRDIINCLGEDRMLVMGRELTKQFETIVKMDANGLLEFLQSDTNEQRGEFVLLIAPQHKLAKPNASILSAEQIDTLKLLLAELPPKKAVNLTHKITKADRELLYKYAVENKSKLSE